MNLSVAEETSKLSQTSIPIPDLFITLNPVPSIDPQKTLQVLMFDHPQLTGDIIKAQPLLKEDIKGRNRSWFCGAYAGLSFHEDAMVMGLDSAERLSGSKNLTMKVKALPRY